MKKLISQNDSFFVAGHNGMVGKALIRALKKEKVIVIIKIKEFYTLNQDQN